LTPNLRIDGHLGRGLNAGLRMCGFVTGNLRMTVAGKICGCNE